MRLRERLARPLQVDARMKLHLALASTIALSGCTLYFGEAEPDPQPQPVPQPDPDPSVPVYQLTKTKAIAGPMPIVGIDSDLEGGIWIAYRQEIGGYYDNDDIRILHLDWKGMKLSEWQYLDEYAWVSGLAFTGDAVWLNYAMGGDFIRKLDPDTGVELARFATGGNVVDLERGEDPDTLLLSKSLNAFTTISTADGGEIHKAYLDAVTWTTQEGLAAVNGQRWIASRASKDLSLLDANGFLIARGANTVLESWNYNDIFLAWDGSQLMLGTGAQIFWLSIAQ
jgi:hypothetical protein